MTDLCPLCGRSGVMITAHHLVPKSLKHETDTIDICNDCHSAIHARYSNKELGERFFSLELLQKDDDLRRAFKFLSKQSSLRRFSNKQSNSRKKKGKYG
jgi:hypothetical protein